MNNKAFLLKNLILAGIVIAISASVFLEKSRLIKLQIL